MTIAIPPEVGRALGPIVGALAAEGFFPAEVELSPSFGNFSVVFSRGPLKLSIVRDRGQLHIGGVERSVLEPAGLWRSFSGPQAIVAPMLTWLRAR